MTPENGIEIARKAYDRHTEVHGIRHYFGILSMHGQARLSQITGDANDLDKVREALLPFVRGERAFHCNFPNYQCGGLGAAYLLWKGHLPEAEDTVHFYAEEIMNDAPRDPDGILCMISDPNRRQVWIDVSFAVTPFLLFAGLTFGEDSYIEEAFQQTRKMVELFRDPENGLLHQCRDFCGPGKISEDHWSRGNGWGMLGLTELVGCLPDDDPRRPASEALFTDLVKACLNVQDHNGMWHQELTAKESYVETSGTGLILYGLGIGIEKGILGDDIRPAYEKGLQGYRQYITDAGDVFHTCRGCLCPGEGRIIDYMARAPEHNDPHSFGPVTLAFGQAALALAGAR